MSYSKILVVEDERIVAEDIRENLEQLGYEVPEIASSGEEAVAAAERVRPDLVMMDVRIRGTTDGIEAVEQIYRKLDVPVIYLTAFADEKTLERAKKTRPFGYLIKPFKERELHTTIEVALYKHGMEVQLKELQEELQGKVQELERQDAHIRRLSLAVEQSPAAVMITDTEGNIEYVNAKFSEVTGYSIAEVLGENPRLLKSGKQSPDFYRELWGRIKNGEEWHGEFHNRKKSGELNWESASISPIRSPEGEITHFVAVKEDITERKREEVRRLARQQLLDEVWRMRGPDDIGRLLEGLKVCLEELEIPFYASEINLIDASAEGAPGTHSFSLLQSGEWKKEETDAEEGLILQIWRSGELFYRPDLRREDPHREREHIEGVYGSVRAVIDVPFSHGTLSVNSLQAEAFADYDIASLQALAEVLSEGFRRLEDLQSLEEKENQLRQSQKMEAVGQLAGGVAHDFNNLITIITGYCQLLSKRLDPEDAAYQNVQEIYKSGERAATLVRQLLAFSRRQVLKPELLNLNGVVADVEKMLHRLIGEDIELVCSGKEGLGQVEADPGQLEQVIINLAVNARDAMPDGGKLTIETANVELDGAYADHHAEMPPGPYVLMAVSDTGVGMDGETRVRIFEPFFTTKDKGKGTGLGLSTVYGIVRQSNGFIWVYSEPGKGTTFKIYLPRIERQVDAAQVETEPEERFEGTETILVVEDDDTVRELVQRIFKEYGYSVIEARNGEEGLQVCAQRAGEIDLLLTDVVMPGMNGPELAAYVTGMKEGIKVLYMSGYADRAISRNGLVKDDIQFLQKPFTPDELLRKTRETLDEREGV